jgi:hypothetical protein
MSALGQKQTCAAQNGMSALHPKADMCTATRYVRFVPKADMALPHSVTNRRSSTRHKRQNVGFGSALINNRYCLRCLQVMKRAFCCRMVDDSHQHAENAEAILKVAYCRDGVDVAVQAAIHMISIATALLTSESGPEESRRILQIVGEAQGKAS